MSRLILLLALPLLLLLGCTGQQEQEATSAEASSVSTPTTAAVQAQAASDPVRDALEVKIEPLLLRSLPGLEEEEASCLSGAILAKLPDFGTAPEDTAFVAVEIVAAMERCLTPDRIVELGRMKRGSS